MTNTQLYLSIGLPIFTILLTFLVNWRMLASFRAEVNRRFDDVNRRFEGVDRRFEGVDKRIDPATPDDLLLGDRRTARPHRRAFEGKRLRCNWLLS